MLRITVNRSSAGAKKYYTEDYYSEGKNTLDYYSEKDKEIGLWGGEAAKKLGLAGQITKEDFYSLCDNLHPANNNKLTERTNSERRVGYDLTFNAFKSLTLAYTFGTAKDKQDILKVFHESVQETMAEIESAMQTRVRVKGQNDNRETGNIIYSEHTHFTSRPIDGIADPHLHKHCFLFNATYDNIERKWKAIELGQINKDAPYYEAVFHATLANKLQALGYGIEKTKNGFEIKGVSRETIEKFSRRTEEIEHLAQEKNITSDKSKDKLGARTRESKRNAISETEQKKHWDNRLTVLEKTTLRNLRKDNYSEGKGDRVGFDIIGNAVAKDTVEHSLHHHLERKSVTTDKEILALSIKSSLGQTTVAEVKKAFSQNSSVISVKENGQNFITTKKALAEENKLIEMAYATKGKFKSINENYQPKAEHLTDEQKNAIKKALTSTDGITIIAGKAGTGKTTLMKEVQAGIRESSKNIFAFAPSAEASRGVQRREGFENAETLAALIQNKELQGKIKDGVVWVDEAGMISNKDMNHVLRITKEQNARLILTGDTKQHTSVERGDALRILQKEAGITAIQVSKIQRQKNQQYKEAVSALSKSEIEKGFTKLDKMSAIHEIADSNERVNRIADDYIRSTYGNVNTRKTVKEVLVVSPTHIEGEKVTEKIRAKLKDENIIGKSEKTYTTFKNLQLTEAEKQKAENYVAGDWLIFHQNTKGIKAGSRYQIAGTERESVLLKAKTGNVMAVPIEKAANFNVFQVRDMNLSQGDKIRITGNGKTNEGKHLFNGTQFNVTGFDRQGNIKLSNGSIISKEYGQFTYGYVMTSHSSQGKTVDKVIISQSSMSFRASSKEQFYVSVSRGKQAVSIYTDDKAELLRAVSQSGERKSAIELTKQKERLNNVIEINRTGLLQRIKERALAAMDKIKSTKTNKDHEQLQRTNITKATGRGR